MIPCHSCPPTALLPTRRAAVATIPLSPLVSSSRISAPRKAKRWVRMSLHLLALFHICFYGASQQVYICVFYSCRNIRDSLLASSSSSLLSAGMSQRLRESRYMPGINSHAFKMGGHVDKLLERSLGRHRDALASERQHPGLPSHPDRLKRDFPFGANRRSVSIRLQHA